MEIQPHSGMEVDFSGEPLEGAAVLYSRAEVEEESLREFAANRREYGAQMRHRAAEELRQMELRAQAEAEAAAAQADAEAEAAQAEAAAAGVRLAATRKMIPLAEGVLAAGWEVEEQVEHMRRAALREAAQQARRAAAERLEAARRAEAAAMADSIARREEREIAEAQATILRQAAKYAEAEMRSRRRRHLQPDMFLPSARAGRGSDWNRQGLIVRSEAEPRRPLGSGAELRQRRPGPEPMAWDANGRKESESRTGQGTSTMEEREAPPVSWESYERARGNAAEAASAGSVEAADGSRETVIRDAETALDEARWFEAESLIGCGYSKLEGTLPRGRESGRGADVAQSPMVEAEVGAEDPACAAGLRSAPGQPRWSALKEVLARAEHDQKLERTRDRVPDWTHCRVQNKEKGRQDAPPVRRNAAFVAIYSQAGGAGKTSLAANLGRALASLGERVLIAEITGQRLLPLYFGGSGVQAGEEGNVREPAGDSDGPVDLISYDVAAREMSPGKSGRDVHGEVFQDLVGRARRADRVLIDLSVSCGWMVARMAWMNPTILVPLAADMNSVVSLEAVERRFNVMQDAEGRPLGPVYLLNQFDDSMPLQREVRGALRQRLGERLLPFAVRRSSGVSDALAEGMTIIDYDSQCDVAKDCFQVAEWLRAYSAAPDCALA